MNVKSFFILFALIIVLLISAGCSSHQSASASPYEGTLQVTKPVTTPLNLIVTPASPTLPVVHYKNTVFNSIDPVPRMSSVILINDDNETHTFRTTSTSEQRYEQKYDAWTLSPGEQQQLEIQTNRNHFEILVVDNYTVRTTEYLNVRDKTGAYQKKVDVYTIKNKTFTGSISIINENAPTAPLQNAPAASPTYVQEPKFQNNDVVQCSFTKNLVIVTDNHNGLLYEYRTVGDPSRTLLTLTGSYFEQNCHS